MERYNFASELEPDPLFHETDPRIQNQKETDPKHWSVKYFHTLTIYKIMFGYRVMFFIAILFLVGVAGLTSASTSSLSLFFRVGVAGLTSVPPTSLTRRGRPLNRKSTVYQMLQIQK